MKKEEPPLLICLKFHRKCCRSTYCPGRGHPGVNPLYITFLFFCPSLYIAMKKVAFFTLMEPGFVAYS